MIMEQYISKSVLVAEIKNLKNTYKNRQVLNSYTEGLRNGILSGYNDALNKINSLEVKELSIEDSIKETLAQKYINYTFRRNNIDPESREGQLIYYAYMHGMNQCLDQLNNIER